MGILLLFKIMTVPCVIKSSLSMSVLESVYFITWINQDPLRHFPDLNGHLDHFHFFTEVK